MIAPIVQYDACRPAAIPTPNKNERVAGYVDGPCEWPADGWSQFPGIVKVRITIEGDPLADVYDWELGTAPLSVVRTRIATRRDDELASGVYVNESHWAEAVGALRDLPIVWWVAAWRAYDPTEWPTLTVPTGTIRAAAWQHYSGPTYDLSAVDAAAWPATLTVV